MPERESNRRQQRGSSKSRSRSRTRRSKSNRTYRPPHFAEPPQNNVPENLYVQGVGPESGLTDEGPESGVQRIAPFQGADPTLAAYQETDPTAYRLAENPYHGDVHPLSPVHRLKLNKWYQKRFPAVNKSGTGTDNEESLISVDNPSLDDSYVSRKSERNRPQNYDAIRKTSSRGRRKTAQEQLEEAEGDYLRTKQPVAYLCILITSCQLLILMLQLTMCGIAPFDVNMFVGPYPDSFSEWGGINSYLMLHNNEWWRLISSSFLHCGLIHLVLNALCQLDAVALFEREWGSFRWGIVYFTSTVGCAAYSSFFDTNEIAVSSSGALMGVYGAKLAQVVTLSSFELRSHKYDDLIRMDQLTSVLCGMVVLFILSAFTFIDWSGHMGGFVSGFFVGIVLFSNAVSSCCSWFLWVSSGLLALIASLGAVMYFFITTSEPIEEIGDACEYFRSYFPEEYDCNCLWQ